MSDSVHHQDHYPPAWQVNCSVLFNFDIDCLSMYVDIRNKYLEKQRSINLSTSDDLCRHAARFQVDLSDHDHVFLNKVWKCFIHFQWGDISRLPSPSIVFINVHRYHNCWTLELLDTVNNWIFSVVEPWVGGWPLALATLVSLLVLRSEEGRGRGRGRGRGGPNNAPVTCQ